MLRIFRSVWKHRLALGLLLSWIVAFVVTLTVRHFPIQVQEVLCFVIPVLTVILATITISLLHPEAP